MKITIVPDSYKGTLTSKEVCETIKSSLLDSMELEIVTLPFADGGEGFGECYSAFCNGDLLYAPCHDIYFKNITGHIYTSNDTAIIECAVASGLQKKKDVMNASSYGTGELIKFAILKGYKKIIIGLGGSGCSDGGAGALAALGVKFYDKNDNIIKNPTPNFLKYLSKIDTSCCKELVKGISFTYACDVENVYYGNNGAASIFACQKGATKNDIPTIEINQKLLEKLLHYDINSVNGTGAAGGLSGGLLSVCGGTIKSGFDILSDISNLENHIKSSDLVITGEGKTDSQTLMGKLPYKICNTAKKYNVKCAVISGSIDNVFLGDYMISLVDDSTSLDECIKNPKKILFEKTKKILKLLY